MLIPQCGRRARGMWEERGAELLNLDEERGDGWRCAARGRTQYYKRASGGVLRRAVDRVVGGKAFLYGGRATRLIRQMLSKVRVKSLDGRRGAQMRISEQA